MSMPLPRRQTSVCRCPCPDDKLKFVGLSLPRCIGLHRESNRRECRCPCPADNLKFVGLSLLRCIGLPRESNRRECRCPCPDDKLKFVDALAQIGRASCRERV